MKTVTLRRCALRCVMLLAALPGLADHSFAQEAYPNRPVKIVVPFPPGSAADTLPRLIAEKLATRWGQPVVVENRLGAAGNIGADAVAKATPDGYTLLASPPPPIAINQSLYQNLSFDPGAFVAVSIIGSAPNVLAVNADLPATTLTQLIALAHARPGGLNYASTGSGSTPHLSMERLKALTSAPMVHIPHKGLPPAIVDLLAGRVDVMFLNLGDAMRHVRSGKLRVIAVASEQRVAELPGVPALVETYSGFVSTAWYAFVAPPNTPPRVIATLSGAIAETLQQPDVVKRLRDMSIDPVGGSPAQAAAFIQEEIKRWHKIIVSVGIKADE